MSGHGKVDAVAGDDAWKSFVPPSPALGGWRRSFTSGLHVLVWVQPDGPAWAVWSAADHGTMQPTRMAEGNADDEAGTAALVEEVRRRWDEQAASLRHTETVRRARGYRLIEPGGGFSPVLGREDLFARLADGRLSWDDQVWFTPVDVTEAGGWESVRAALGWQASR